MKTFSILIAFLSLVRICGANDGLDLKRKADLFEHDLYTRFVFDGQLAPKMKLPTPARDFVAYNMPDNAYMTGIYTGILAMKYAVTKDEETRRRGSEALEALHLLCNVSGIKGLLARAAVKADAPFDDDGDWQPSPDGKYKWRADVSSDQMDGVFYGFKMAFDLFANEAQKKLIARDVAALMDYLVEHDYRIIDYNGKPTEWGNYTEVYVRFREPMNALLLLQHLKVAHHVTGDAKYAALYEQFAKQKGYAKLAVMARNYRLYDINYSDDVLLWLAYYPLLSLEKDETLLDLYKASLRRAWEGEPGSSHKGIKDEDIPLFFLAAEFLGDASGIERANRTLGWFPLDLKWNRDTIAKYEKQFGFTFDPTPRSPEPKPGDLVPVDRRGKLWSVWVHTPYQTGTRTDDHPMEYNGHDFLMAYWYGRYTGKIR